MVKDEVTDNEEDKNAKAMLIIKGNLEEATILPSKTEAIVKIGTPSCEIHCVGAGSSKGDLVTNFDGDDVFRYLQAGNSIRRIKNQNQSDRLRSLMSLNSPKAERSVLSPLLGPSTSLRSFKCNDLTNTTPTHLKPFPDCVSVRSLISVGMGSTDGQHVTIKRVPTSPSELLNFPTQNVLSDNGMRRSVESIRSKSSEKPNGGGWSNGAHFVLTCVSYSVGLGNLWRFPYLCYKSGGGVFLIPYLLLLVTCGMPLLYMELAIGQFTKRGPIVALGKICPLLKGTGIAIVTVSFFLSSYYNVIVAHTVFYFFSSFRSDPPWKYCNNRWNSEQCWSNSDDLSNRTKPAFVQTPAEEFYNKKLLQISSGIDSMGTMRWELVACLLLMWTLVYFALWKSQRTNDYVLYFTATVPYVLVTLFLGHSLSLEGANIGLRYLFLPRWSLLFDSKVWIYAASQIINSFGFAFGYIISSASRNAYAHRLINDTIYLSLMNAVCSMVVAIFAFATIGNIAWKQNKTVDDVVTDGPGLIFVVYPEALSSIPFSTFWSLLFFFALICLELNTELALVEVFVTSIRDAFPNWMKRKLICHEILVLVVCVASFSIGLLHVTQGGMYFFQLVDHYIASIAVVIIATFEVIAVAWVYGANRFYSNVKQMTGEQPNILFKYCWSVVSPFLLMSVCLFSIWDSESPGYNEYKYPIWSEVLGWSITLLSILPIFIVALYTITRSQGNTLYEKLLTSAKPRIQDYSSQVDYCKDCNIKIPTL